MKGTEAPHAHFCKCGSALICATDRCRIDDDTWSCPACEDDAKDAWATREMLAQEPTRT